MRLSSQDEVVLRLLTFSTLYPNAVQIRHGIFVEQRLRHLLASGRVESRVVAPVPWFPIDHACFGRYSLYAQVPPLEQRHGLEVLHPRYPVIPKIGMSVAPWLLAKAAAASLQQLMESGYNFDVIDAHYFYPDGVAAMLLGRRFGKPVVITARGNDINLIPRYPIARRWILWAAREANGLVTVSQALKKTMVKLGVSEKKIAVLRNGVDLELFHPLDRTLCRAQLGLTRPTLLSVGNLVELKGHHLILQALTRLPEVELLLIGDGPERGRLERLAFELGVADRVRFLGIFPQEKLKFFYNAADISVLASSREGWPNVLLESMACGTAVVATRVGGTPEIVNDPASGRLVQERTPESIAAAVKALLVEPPDRGAVRRYAEAFSWKATTMGQLALFEGAIRNVRFNAAVTDS